MNGEYGKIIGIKTKYSKDNISFKCFLTTKYEWPVLALNPNFVRRLRIVFLNFNSNLSIIW